MSTEDVRQIMAPIWSRWDQLARGEQSPWIRNRIWDARRSWDRRMSRQHRWLWWKWGHGSFRGRGQKWPTYYFLRKNYLTINEDPEIWEVIGAETGDTECFGTAETISAILGTDGWDHNSILTRDGQGALRLSG